MAGVGALARALLGARFHTVARLYRGAFVDLRAVALVLDELLPRGSTVLDVGGGDGAPLNYLLVGRPDLKIAMLDVAPSIGGAVDERYAAQVQLFPKTTLELYDGPRPDAVLVMDVVHHVPEQERPRFFHSLAALATLHRVRRIIIKDVEPGHVRSVIGLLADRYISGDKNVRLVSVESLIKGLQRALGAEYLVEEARLRHIDPPNYCVVAYAV